MSRHDNVVAITAIKEVSISCIQIVPTEEVIIARITVECIGPVRPDHHIVAVTTICGVCSIDGCRLGCDVDFIVTRTAIDQIGSSTAVNFVVTITCNDRVIPIKAIDGLAFIIDGITIGIDIGIVDDICC